MAGAGSSTAEISRAARPNSLLDKLRQNSEGQTGALPGQGVHSFPLGGRGKGGLNVGSTKLMMKMKKRAKKAQYHILPVILPSNRFKMLWDGMISMMILYNMCEIPFRLSFVPLQSEPPPLRILNWVVDCTFAVDIVLNFFTAYKVDETYVTKHKKIAVSYLTTFFVPDVLSTVSGIASMVNRGTTSSTLREMNLLRFLRLVKVFRFAQVVAAAKKLQFVERINPAVLKLVQLMFRIVALAHIIACFWFRANECMSAFNAGPGKDLCPESYSELKCESKCGSQTVASQYLSSFYWTIATMMAVGYGDAVADTPDERLYAMFTQLVGALSFGYIISSVTIIIETFDPSATAKREHMEEMMRFINENQVTAPTQRRIRRHMNFYFTYRSVFPEKEILRGLPDHLLWKATYFTRNAFLQKLSITRRVDVRLATILAQSMQPMRFSSGEVIVREGDVSEDAYFVVSGTVFASMGDDADAGGSSVLVGVFREGDDFELDTVLNRLPVAATYTASSRGEAYWLPREHLWDGAIRQPSFLRSLADQCEIHRSTAQTVLQSPTKPFGALMSREIIMLGSYKCTNIQRLDRLLPKLLQGQSLGFAEGRIKITTWRPNPTGNLTSRSRSYLRRFVLESCLVNTLTDWGIEDFLESHETSGALWNRWIIDPQTEYKIAWDVFLGILTVASVVLVPLQMGLELDTPAWEAVDLTFTAFFFLDILANFRTAFVNDNGVHDTLPAHIARNYLRSWFLIDFVSTAPIEYLAGSASKMARLIRLFRILKLFRLFKLKRLQLPEFILDLDVTVKKGVKLFFTLFFIAHMFGCFFNYVTVAEGESAPPEQQNYTHTYTNWWMEDGLEESQKSERYVAGLYWAITTMTTVGYGDILPRTDSERLFATVIMLMGATVFGYIVGSVSTLARDPNGVAALTASQLNRASAYLREQDLNFDLRSRVRKSLFYVLQEKSPFDEKYLLSCLPRALREAVVLSSYAVTIPRIPFLCNIERDSVVALLLQHISPFAFEDGEVVLQSKQGADGIYAITEGHVQRTFDLGADLSPHTLHRLRGKQLRLQVCTYSSGNFIGHESLIGLPEPSNTEFICRGSCKAHVLLASAVADLIHVHPHAVDVLREGVTKAHDQQQHEFREDLARLDELVASFQKSIFSGNEKKGEPGLEYDGADTGSKGATR